MGTTTSEKVQKHRTSLRASGMRTIQIQVPDTRAQGFVNEWRRQSLLTVTAESKDKDSATFMSDTLTYIDGWAACNMGIL